ncbi:MAG: DUF3012 domain-containing protein [Gammaproteobacteria bacterium]|nr:DUF3012 domain-containing protein [Gammaproteobacteria bacterium]
MKKLSLALMGIILLCGCSPKVGSDEWCKQMEKKPKGDWTANQLKDYTKYCVLNQKPD